MDKVSHNKSLLQPFLPITLTKWYQDHPAQTHSISQHHGALMCLDASGFTVLTGQLESRGQDGPEILTQILNGFFKGIIDITQLYDGDILKFSGDGLWLYLPDPLDVPSFADSAQQSIQTLNSQHDFLKSFPLSLHIGAESGSFDLISFGDKQYRLEVEPVGSVITEAYDCCDKAKSGEIVVGPNLSTQLSTNNNSFVINSPNKTNVNNDKQGDYSSFTFSETVGTDSILWKYIPEALINRISDKSNLHLLDSEYREITVVFCNCSWERHSFEFDQEKIINRVGQIIERVHLSEGCLARIDPFKDGHKFLIIFGAPITRRDDQWRALECARQLSLLDNNGFDIHVGVAHGRAFCGSVGSLSRMEYTVMGSAANLAARLMGKADKGEVLFDGKFREFLPKTVIGTPRQVSVKGFKEPITIYHFDKIEEHTVELASNHNIENVSYLSQKSILESWANSYNLKQTSSIIIKGCPGAGKTHLLKIVESNLSDVYCVSLDGKQSLFFGPGYLARKLILQLAELNPEVQKHGFEQWVNKQDGIELLPVLKGIIEFAPDDNIWTKDLSPQLRAQKATELYDDLINNILCNDVAVLVDDIDKADSYSRKLIFSLLKSNSTFNVKFLIAGTDINDIQNEYENNSVNILELSLPTENEWLIYLKRQFSDGKREDEFIRHIITQSGYVPGIVFEFLKGCITSGDVIFNPVINKWELTHSATPRNIPGSARELHLERFDTLPDNYRAILKVCAVNPAEFSAELIQAENPDIKRDNLISALSFLRQSGILSGDTSGTSYHFTNGSLKNAIYECIPHITKKLWHQRCAQWTEQHSPNLVSLLAYHFANAQICVKGFSYSLKAAKDALTMYSLSDASHHFDNCKKLLDSDTQHEIEQSQIVDFYQTFAQFLVLEGRTLEAYKTFRIWRRSANQLSDNASAFTSSLCFAELLWQQSKYGRCTKVLQAALSRETSNDFPELVARAMTLLAEVARRTGRFQDAESWARKAVEQSDVSIARADAYNRLGLAYWGQGKLADAVECLQKSLSSGQGTHSMYNRARVANNLAIVYWQMGALVQAEPLMKEAIEIFRRQGDRRNEAYARGNLAALIREFGRHSEARKMLNEADVIFERLGDRHAHYYTVGNLGDIDLVSGDIENARLRFNEALSFAESVEDSELQAECKVRLGELAFFTGDIQGANTSLTTAMELSDSIGSGEFALRARVGLARVRVGLKEVDTLIPLIDRIRRDAQESRTTVMDQEGLFLLGEYYRITGDSVKALDNFIEVLKYSKEQNLFELSVKCAVRIAELKDLSYLAVGDFLVELEQRYEHENGKDSWIHLLDSAYFSFFRSVLIATTKNILVT